MSRKGNYYDNAPVKSLYRSPDKQVHRQFREQAEARQATVEYIEEFYNRHKPEGSKVRYGVITGPYS